MPSPVTIDPTGVLVVEGQKLFPLGLSNPPPVGKQAPNGKEGLQEVKSAGVNFIRTGRGTWTAAGIDDEISDELKLQNAAADHGLNTWLYLGDVPDLPGPQGSSNEALLTKIVNAFKGHAALGAYKAMDEPRNPFRGEKWIRPAGLVLAYQKLKALDPDHPVVIIQAPRSPVAALTPYRPAFDITGADIFPLAYPPGEHSDLPNHDLSVVGDITRKMVQAAGGKPVWTTLQIAWTGTLPSDTHPNVVPRFPSLHDERFMAYQAIVSGARGLMFFGGHLTQVMRPADAQAGWNWRFWDLVLRPVLLELTSDSVRPALVAPNSGANVRASAGDVELVARQTDQFLYVIAVRRGNTTTQVAFTGLPRRRDGSAIAGGEVMFEYVQRPLPPPVEPNKQVFRPMSVTTGGFRDWFGPQDVHVYRFAR